MFSKSKYTTWYNNIINRALTQPRKKGKSIYFESHHIIPKCLAGLEGKANLVLLTAKEHFICHLLLIRMVTDAKIKHKMAYAFYSNFFGTSNIYSHYKAKQMQKLSEYTTGIKRPDHSAKMVGRMLGNKNPMFGKSSWNKGLTKSTDERIGVGATKLLGRKLTVEARNNLSKAHGWTLKSVLSPNGVYYEIINLSEFCSLHKLSIGRMSSLCNEKSLQYKGWKLI